MKTNDVSQSPETPQFQVGATTDEAELHQQLVHSSLQGPGAIVSRLGQQFEIPKASPDATMSRDHSTPYG